MPAGAFKIIWDMLNRQEATCAYVNNLAGDGSAYWAFATIMPIRPATPHMGPQPPTIPVAARSGRDSSRPASWAPTAATD